MLAWAGAVSAWPQLPADEEGLRQLSERRDNANREYQLGRAAYERGDFKTAEPLFKRASEYAPEFPEPHFALAQLMQRSNRQAEAQHHMSLVNQRVPQRPAGELLKASGQAARPLLEHAKETARTLRRTRPGHCGDGGGTGDICRALVVAARALEEGRALVAEMAKSSAQQDQHNSRIHAAQQLEAEAKLREVFSNPLEANLWWQLALLSFNNRREFESAAQALDRRRQRSRSATPPRPPPSPSPPPPAAAAAAPPPRVRRARPHPRRVRACSRAQAFEAAMRLSSSPTSRASYFLLFHAWQHLCDWRDWPLRQHQLRASAYASLDDRAAGQQQLVRALQPPYALQLV